MRRLSGMDINGWHDFAARNWEPDDPLVLPPNPILVDGGIHGVVVRQESGVWIGGPQAKLSPHGRGLGWGKLGDPVRRVQVTEICDDLAKTPGEARDLHTFKAIVDSLAREAHSVTITVPDHDAFAEASQARLLNLLGHGRRAHRLLWRPVALFLDALEVGSISRDLEGGLVRLLIHSSSGIEMQSLRLRGDRDHPGHLAPERDGYGRIVVPELALGAMLRRAQKEVTIANPSIEIGSGEKSQLASKLLFGQASAGETEILRNDNGTWMEIVAPRLDPCGVVQPYRCDGVAESKEVVATFLATPLAEPYATMLADSLSDQIPDLHRLEWSSIARGSLRAAQLIERGLPHYFDRLTPIGLAILKGELPHFEDLVGTQATLPANREYVSPIYDGLIWGRGKKEIDFYVVKGEREVRHWRAQQDEPPTKDVNVELRLRQTPGQSWARLSLTSPEWEPLQRSPILLDWEKISVVEESPEEILTKLRSPPPIIPDRIVELANMEFWTGNARYRGILDCLQDGPSGGADQMAKLLSRSMRDPETRARTRPVGTNGELPLELSGVASEAFMQSLNDMGQFVQLTLREPRRRLRNNDYLRCLTWVFTLCPENVQNAIVDALEADLRGSGHPLLAPANARTVLTQGAGRALTGPERIGRALVVLAARPSNSHTLNALAMILSRRSEAPASLTGELVRRIADRLVGELRERLNRRNFLIRFRNALSAAAGLFRYREVEPYALLSARDPTAQRLRDVLSQIGEALGRERLLLRNQQELRETVVDLIKLLDGEGDPNILHKIDRLDDDDDGNADGQDD